MSDRPTPRKARMVVWRCEIEWHVHGSMDAASKCIARRWPDSDAATRKAAKRTQARERREQMLLLREQGKTYRAIGDLFGFSAARASQLCKYAERQRRFHGVKTTDATDSDNV